ncbi:DUF6261 family protein [Saccharicrinis aurantiacus]|uniref:DUF6261 family protein n=1 Tax=Saccharicrinis aurantiacus TaxID=1849719 RepID=UPI002492A64F|nr:DUF6261 family protein [Saccharicrinis aurantiacus]
MIKKVISQTRTTEINMVAYYIIDCFTQAKITADDYASELFHNVAMKAEELTSAINPTKVKSDLKEKDELRKLYLVAMHHLLLGFVRHPNKDVNQSALVIKEIFDKYGVKLAYDSYAVKTAYINALLKELHDAKKDIDTLPGFPDLISGLNSAELAFEEAEDEYATRVNEFAQKSSATQIKAELMTLINSKLVPYLQAMLHAKPHKFESLSRNVAAIIDDNNQTVKARSKPRGIKK